ncbi:MAG: precorrin-6A reductase [Actinomycetota bacterium]|nr:precorrin-6A reductase [Actinomycetota bacterium]
MILLLGGTTEARLLLEKLTEERIPVIFSTAYEFAGEFIDSLAVENPLVKHIAGKLDADAMVVLIDSEKVALLVDATHPFATGVSENARAACEVAGVPYLRVDRALAGKANYENIEYARSMEEAARIAAGLAQGQSQVQSQGPGATIFIATGSNQAGLFAERIDISKHRVYIRVLPGDESVAKCLEAGFAPEQVITGVGPFSVEENERLWRSLGVTVVVTKESGREGGFPEKVEAAKRLGITLVVVERPGIVREDDSRADKVLDFGADEGVAGSDAGSESCGEDGLSADDGGVAGAVEVSGVDEAMAAIKRVICNA